MTWQQEIDIAVYRERRRADEEKALYIYFDITPSRTAAI